MRKLEKEVTVNEGCLFRARRRGDFDGKGDSFQAGKLLALEYKIEDYI